MKKRLLTLGTLALTLIAKAQIVYVGDGAKFYVSTQALVYSGGNWAVDSNKEKTVENKGDIVIVGDYKKGSGISDAAQDGKEFVNIYLGPKSYGQVKLLSTTGNSDARMTIERPAASSNYYGASFATSYPYKDNVSYLMKSFNLSEDTFRGDCALNTVCGNRYKMTLTKWNNDKLHHDAVLKADALKAGDYYNLNLREPNMQQVMVGTIGYKGTPDGTTYTRTAKGIIEGLSEAQFTSATYDNWKVRRNPYNELYQSYMGYVNTADRIYGKNTYRFGNPYTSNLDLSIVDGNDAWLHILNNGGRKTIHQATGTLIKNFTIQKRMASYDVDWGKVSGGINANENYYTAKYDGTKWVGSAEALIVRPTETFNLKFPTLNANALGKTRVVNIEVKFNDTHKTFSHNPSAYTATGTNLSLATLSRSLATPNATNDFYQLEISLAKNNILQSSSAYIVGDSSSQESGDTEESTDKLFVYGLKNGAVAYDSKKTFNEFNTISSVGKPLGIGFNNLEEGATYELNFRLFEKNITNIVDKSSTALFFLKDKKENKIIAIKPNHKINFVADANVATRFEVYWKEVSKTTTTNNNNNTSNVLINTTSKTSIYTEGGQNKLRFENISNIADIEIFNASGRLEYSVKSVSTNSDYTLKLNSQGMYIVRVKYHNGETKVVKFINN